MKIKLIVQRAAWGLLVAVLAGPLFVMVYYSGYCNYSLRDSLSTFLFGFSTDTAWAVGYSERNFKRIRIGMPRDEVQRIMGEPIWKPHPGYWGYTSSPTSTHYHRRSVLLSPSGHVTTIVSEFYFD